MTHSSIPGIGTDIIEVSRIKRVLSRHEGDFLRKVFTESETGYCSSMKHPHRHYAARFAAKEAFLKAIGTGWSDGASWTEIEITRKRNGKPGLQISGRTLELAKEAGFSVFLLSMSHTDRYATATVLAL